MKSWKVGMKLKKEEKREMEIVVNVKASKD